MYCESCGSFVRDGLSYCPACGAKIIEVFVPTMPKEAPAPAPAPGPAQAQAPAYAQTPAYAQNPAYAQAPSYASQPAYAQAPAQPAYSQPIQPAPPVTAGNSVPILQAPVVQSIPISQQAGQPLTQSVEVDPAYARRVQIAPPRQYVENPMAKTGLICGIISLPTMYLPFLNVVPVVLGIVFSLKGLQKAKELDNKPKAVTGLVLSCVGGAMGLYATILWILKWAGMLN